MSDTLYEHNERLQNVKEASRFAGVSMLSQSRSFLVYGRMFMKLCGGETKGGLVQRGKWIMWPRRAFIVRTTIRQSSRRGDLLVTLIFQETMCFFGQ